MTFRQVKTYKIWRIPRTMRIYLSDHTYTAPNTHTAKEIWKTRQFNVKDRVSYRPQTLYVSLGENTVCSKTGSYSPQYTQYKCTYLFKY